MPRLTPAQKRDLVTMIAQRLTYREVIAEFEKKHKLTLYHRQVRWYKTAPLWQSLLKEIRKKHDDDITEEVLAAKRERLRRLDEVYTKAMEPAYAGTDKESGRDKYAFSPGAAVQALKQAQEEVEGRKVRLAGPEGGPVEAVVKIVWADQDGYDNANDNDRND